MEGCDLMRSTTIETKLPVAMNQRHNICLSSDAYKFTQDGLDPENIEKIMEYTTIRGGVFNECRFFGLQYLIKNYLLGEVVTIEKIDKAEKICNRTFGFNYFKRDHWEYILREYDGKLPILIRAVPEGMIVPMRNVLMTIENTDPQCAWLSTYLESLNLKVAFPSTVCTYGWNVLKMSQKFADECGSPLPLCFDNDFGYRACHTEEEAEIGGMAHLINSPGGDTMVALQAADDFYTQGTMLSVRATEHHTMQVYGKEREKEAYEHCIDVTSPEAILSLVTDTYDYEYAQNQILGTELHDKILNRSGKIVMRPDSGYPPEVLIKTLNTIKNKFGYTVNSKGYIINNQKLGILMGDSINFDMMKKSMMVAITENKFDISNFCFGSGGKRYAVERDTLGFTTKACAYMADGVWYPTSKTPVNNKFKHSIGGRLKLCKENGEFITKRYEESGSDLMIDIFKNGELLKDWTFNEVKNNVGI